MGSVGALVEAEADGSEPCGCVGAGGCEDAEAIVGLAGPNWGD